MSNTKYYYELDILRGIACLLVFFCHLSINQIFKPLVFFSGANGVCLFFVISGFIISKLFGDTLIKSDISNLKNWYKAIYLNKEDIYKFWWRRFYRLFPAFCLMVCCAFIATIEFALTYGDITDAIFAFIKFANNLLFLEVNDKNLTNMSNYPIPQKLVLGVTWSINCEILFYFIFPFIVIFRNFKEMLPVIVAALILFKFILTCFIPYPILHGHLFMHFDDFGVGILIGYYHKSINFNHKLLKIFLIVALINLIISSPDITYRSYIHALISSAVLVYIASMQQGMLNVPLLGTFLNFIGRRSYFIYMMHNIIDYFMWVPFKRLVNSFPAYKGGVFSDQNPEIINHYRHLVVFLIVIVLSEIFYRFVERRN